MFDLIKIIKKEHLYNAFIWFFLSSLGGLLPTWGLLIILRLYNQEYNLLSFTQNGEFFLYSASMVSASLYVITKSYFPKLIRQKFSKRKEISPIKVNFPGHQFFNIVLLFILVISALIFAVATSANLPGNNRPIDIIWLSASSTIIFIVTLILSFAITVIDEAAGQSEEDLRRYFTDPIKSLSDEFDELQEKED